MNAASDDRSCGSAGAGTIWSLPCHFQSLSLMNCKSRAEAFAKSLQSKLRYIGRLTGDGTSDDDESAPVGPQDGQDAHSEHTRLMMGKGRTPEHSFPAPSSNGANNGDEFFDFDIGSSPASPSESETCTAVSSVVREPNHPPPPPYHQQPVVVQQPREMECRGGRATLPNGLAAPLFREEDFAELYDCESGCVSAMSSVMTEQDNNDVEDAAERYYDHDDLLDEGQWTPSPSFTWTPQPPHCSPVLERRSRSPTTDSELDDDGSDDFYALFARPSPPNVEADNSGIAATATHKLGTIVEQNSLDDDFSSEVGLAGDDLMLPPRSTLNLAGEPVDLEQGRASLEFENSNISVVNNGQALRLLLEKIIPGAGSEPNGFSRWRHDQRNDEDMCRTGSNENEAEPRSKVEANSPVEDEVERNVSVPEASEPDSTTDAKESGPGDDQLFSSSDAELAAAGRLELDMPTGMERNADGETVQFQLVAVIDLNRGLNSTMPHTFDVCMIPEFHSDRTGLGSPLGSCSKSDGKKSSEASPDSESSPRPSELHSSKGSNQEHPALVGPLDVLTSPSTSSRQLMTSASGLSVPPDPMTPASGLSAPPDPMTPVSTSEDDPRRIRRSSSLKSAKTPPGTPRHVIFADTMGLLLADVRTICSDDLPNVPSSAFDDLEMASTSVDHSLDIPSFACSAPTQRGTLVPVFPQPVSLPNFEERLRRQSVCLESATVSGDVNIVRLVLRVLNLDFHKTVTVRYSLDGWRTHAELVANYAGSSSDGGRSDRFSTVLLLNRIEVGERLSFAVRFVVLDREFWDNNDGLNYNFQCYPDNVPSPLAAEDSSWVHFL